MSGKATVLFDAPGPKAKRRNTVIGVVGVVLLALAAFWIYHKFDETGQFSRQKWDPFQYSGIQQLIFDGLKATLKAFALAVVFSLILGALLAAGRLSDHRPIRWAATAFVTFFRAMPLLIMIYFLYKAPPMLSHWPGFLDFINDDPMWPLVIGLTLYNGTVQAETMRAGILALPRGQSEAAYAIGMRKSQVMASILVPQGIRAMLPSIISQMVVTLKDTSLGFVITYPELLHTAKQIGSVQDYDLPLIPAAIVVGTIYIVICMLLSASAVWLERFLSRGRQGRPPKIQPPTAEAVAQPGVASGV
ncbi:amino acid ABC transporter permease [Yinghuangia sp. ASG 101]|uniref:amino acid ABC transporter permease n=1 Tax=Yinghuangia sp. ASG 101 TaxID=2896848 RepID=UPI001E564391|nr:amino acid ABC transporter permease [Yinghuangia sp. ASG 101]UGQ13923.1 amino acid ABC transporter permease [Yinghuangia sp. ASG 101]